MDTIGLTVSVVEAGLVLGIGRNFAYKLVAEGVIPSLKFGSKIRIPRIALEALLNSCSHNCEQLHSDIQQGCQKHLKH